MTVASILTTSPQKADPLTWVLSFNLPLMAALSTTFGGIGLTLLLAPQGVPVFATLIATALSTLGCLVVMRASRPHRPIVQPVETLLPMGLGLASMAVSALGHVGSDVPLYEWSGPLGLVTVLLALVPYSSAVITAAWGVVGAAAAALLSLTAFTLPGVGQGTIVIVGSSLPLHVGITGAAFSSLVVAAITRWRALPYDREESSDRPAAFESRLREHGTPVVIDDNVTTLLERVADGGRVTAKDREDAAALAAAIRADLVRVMDQSWLETIPQRERVSVHDPDNAANRMTRSQRAAVHTIITAALESPVLAGQALRLELRSLDDGTTAVALSMNITLPEGRRVMMLAPYFISLKASVDDLEWAVGEQLRLHFKLPAPTDESAR